MKVICPNCGKSVMVNGIGRKPLNIAVNNVYDALRLHRNVSAAAIELGCSRAYIYLILKSKGLTPADVIKGLATKDNRLLQKQGEINGQQQ